MTRKKLNLKPEPAHLLKLAESDLKFINGYNNVNRSTKMDYEEVGERQIPVVRYNIYDGYPELVHGFSTRLGGVSK